MNTAKSGQKVVRKTETADSLIDHLNEDLAGELQAVCMYVQYSALLTGPYRKELRDLFQAEIPDEQRHAQFLADKISVLGGTPKMVPRPVPNAKDAQGMLQHVLEAEAQAITDYTARATEAEAMGEIGLKVELENVIVDETRHRDEVEQILTGWHQASSGAPSNGRREKTPFVDR